MTSSFFIENNFEVKKIQNRDTRDFILNKHYAKRMPSISYAYGLFVNGNLEGVLTIGKPASNSLCKGVCGEEYSKKVYELNRLVINEGFERNTLSWFVGQVLKSLKQEDLILVSYADSGMNHCGYIYIKLQTGFIRVLRKKELISMYHLENIADTILMTINI